MSRTVRVNLSSHCGRGNKETIHQPTAVQLSIGDRWIPPNGPIVFPTPPDPTQENPTTNVSDIAKALNQAVKEAASSGVDARNVSNVSRNTTTRGSAPVFSFTFETDADEIDFGVAGLRYSGGQAREKARQLGMQVIVGDGPAAFTIKTTHVDFVISSVNRGGFVDDNGQPVTPGDSYPGPKRKRVRKGRSDKEGDQLLDILPGWAVTWDEWYTALPYWGSQVPPVQPWELEPLARGFLSPAITEAAEGEITTWQDAMTRGDSQLLASLPLHWAFGKGEFDYRGRPLWSIDPGGRPGAEEGRTAPRVEGEQGRL